MCICTDRGGLNCTQKFSPPPAYSAHLLFEPYLHLILPYLPLSLLKSTICNGDTASSYLTSHFPPRPYSSHLIFLPQPYFYPLSQDHHCIIMSGSTNKHDVNFLLNSPRNSKPLLPSSPKHLSASDQKIQRNTCKICGHCFAQTADLRKHIRTVHEGRRDFKSDKCNKSFGERGNLKKHERSVHLKERPFSCSQCQSSFAFKDGLARHIALVHDNSRPFKCARCGNSYKQVAQ